MNLCKRHTQEACPRSPSPEDLALINGYSRKPLAAEEVYIFQTVLCDNEVDRDGDRFATAALSALAALFPGKTGLFDHSMKAGDQMMRIYAAQVRTVPGKTNSLGEDYAQLLAKVYLLRGEATRELIRQIDAGIKKEVSVSCAIRLARCSVCGKPFGRGDCTHQKGVDYGKGQCHAVLEEPTDAYEFSFVAVPAQPAAGVIKSLQGAAEHPGERRFTHLTALKRYLETDGCGIAQAQSAREELEQLEALALDGASYREDLLRKATRAALLFMPELGAELTGALCEKLSARQLSVFAQALELRAEKIVPLRPQLQAPAPGGSGENDGYKF
ncbi:MAG: hypothetical protein LBQ33_03760 [Oscillospiraceae bacterium]|nr:hypothetical protein [Oscillospiraceae bacterium]